MAKSLRIWALLGARAGDNDQVIALAEALGLPFEAKQLHYNRLQLLGPRLLGRSLASLDPASRKSIVAEPAPDVTISTGHRSVAVVRQLRRRSGGRTRSIHIGFPRISPAHFDLVITTPQYEIADHPNLLRIPYALTRTATENSSERDANDAMRLPSPRQLLIVGGPTLFWQLDPEKLLGALEQMIVDARMNGGSVMVSTSPRTPPAISTALSSRLSSSGVKSILARPGQPSVYRDLLAAATAIRVSADSVSMISDAIWTGKPMALVPICASRSGQIMLGLQHWLGHERRAYPQDLRFFWRALETIGVGSELAVPRTAPGEIMNLVRARAMAVIDLA